MKSPETLELVPPSDPVLWTPAKDVTDENIGQVAELLPEFIRLLMRNRGVGLAAPQVGIGLRFFAFKNGQDLSVALNPEILSHGKKLTKGTEGCLSKPGFQASVRRWREITVRFWTPGKEWVTMDLKSFDARVFQHELDHLNGVCIFDPELVSK